jgi:hypothetical protein
MAVLQVNPPGMSSTAEGYISSITIRTGGVDSALVPNANTGQVTIAAAAISNIVANVSKAQCMKLVTG